MENPPLFYTLQPLILASASPRRRKMLRKLGLEVEVVPVQLDETPLVKEKPENFAERMARTKATAAAGKNPASWVLGADTVVSIAGNIMGKPKDHREALAILKQLVNNTHQVLTGTCLCCMNQNFHTTWVESTKVTFIDAADDILESYIRTGEPLDKAGAYGIQGMGSFLVREIQGSCTNVIGLPLDSVILLLLQNKIIAPKLQENSF